MMNHPKPVTNDKHLTTMSPPNKNKITLHDTHTKEWVSPPIMKTKRNRYRIRRKPQKGIPLHFFNNIERINNHVFEDTVVSLLPNCPSASKSNNLKIHQRGSRKSGQMNKLKIMFRYQARKNTRDTQPVTNKIPDASKNITTNE